MDDRDSDATPSQLMAISRMQGRLQDEGHYLTNYDSADQLVLLFGRQLDKLALVGFARKCGSTPTVGLQGMNELTSSTAAATEGMLTFAAHIHDDVESNKQSIIDEKALLIQQRLTGTAAQAKRVLGQHQAVLIEEIDEWLSMQKHRNESDRTFARRREADWHTIIDRLQTTMVNVRELLDAIGAERSDFVHRPSYEALIQTTASRLSILEKVGRLPMPKGDDEVEAVRRLSVRYSTLLQSFRCAVNELSRYVEPIVAELKKRQRLAQDPIEREKRIKKIIADALEAQRQESLGRSTGAES